MARRVHEEGMRSAAGFSLESALSSFSEVELLQDVTLEKQLGAVFSLQYNYDGSTVSAGFSGGGIKMYDSRTGQLLKDLRPNRHGGYAVMCLRYHPKDPKLLYAGTAEGLMFLINTDTLECKQIINEPQNQINTMDFCMDGYYFCTCGKDLNVRIYETKSSKLFKTYEGYGTNLMARANMDMEAGNTMRVYSLKFHPDNENIFITAGWDNHIKIWDLRTSDGIKRQIHGPHVCGDAIDIQDRNILSGSWCANHALQEWDYGEGTMVREIKFPHTNGAFLYSAQYGDLGVVLAGGSGTNSVEVVEAATDRHIGGVKLGKAVQAMDSALGGRLFAVGGQDRHIKLCATK